MTGSPFSDLKSSPRNPPGVLLENCSPTASVSPAPVTPPKAGAGTDGNNDTGPVCQLLYQVLLGFAVKGLEQACIIWSSDHGSLDAEDIEGCFSIDQAR